MKPLSKNIIIPIEENVPTALTQTLSKGVKKIQSGSLAFYALLFIVGLSVMGIWSLWNG